jgi:hypothetical protein
MLLRSAKNQRFFLKNKIKKNFNARSRSIRLACCAWKMWTQGARQCAQQAPRELVCPDPRRRVTSQYLYFCTSKASSFVPVNLLPVLVPVTLRVQQHLQQLLLKFCIT